MLHCPSCKSYVRDNSRFCRHCGHALKKMKTPARQGSNAHSVISSSNGAAKEAWEDQGTMVAQSLPSSELLTLPPPPVSQRETFPFSHTPPPHPAVVGPPRTVVEASEPKPPPPQQHRDRRLELIAYIGLPVLILIIISGIFLLLPPTLSLGHSNHVFSGEIVHLHGSGLMPGGSAKLLLDDRLSLHPVTHSSADGFVYGTGSPELPAKSAPPVTVSGLGTFDVAVLIDESWALGPHTLHATNWYTRRSAILTFTIDPRPVQLVVSPSILDFGEVETDTKTILPVVVHNTGSHPLRWTIDTGKTTWLKPLSRSGILPPAHQQFIYVVADTTQLALQMYSAILHIRTDSQQEIWAGGKVQVVAHEQVKQARLHVNSSRLDFGSLMTGKQASTVLIIGNTGTQRLSWQADTSSARWLTVDRERGTIPAGDLPQVVQVTINTSHLPAGSYSAALHVNSNGRDAVVPIAFTVIKSEQQVNSPALLTVSSTRFTNGCLSCAVTLTSHQSKGDLNWNVSSSGMSGVIFNPPVGTLSPGQSVQVSMTVPNTPCPANATFAFTTMGDSATTTTIGDMVTTSWSCSAVPPAQTPLLTTNLAGFPDGCLSCVVTLSPASGSHGTLVWSASSSGISGITFRPSSGTLLPGQMVQVIVTVPGQKCPASATINFKGAANTASAPWSCGGAPLQTPVFTINASALDQTNSGCTGGSSWTCTVTVGETPNSPGGITWSASSDMEATFSPQSGLLKPGDTMAVKISSLPCHTGIITFSGSGRVSPVNVPWSCASTSPTALTLAVNPATLNAKTGCLKTSSGDWNCNVNLTASAGSGTLSWSAQTYLAGVTFAPQNGVLAPGQSEQVSILVPDNACSYSSFNFAGPANTVAVSWACVPPPPALTVNANTINGNTDCSYASDSGWTCTLIVSNTDRSNQVLDWSTSSDVASFSPPSGTLAPNTSAQVSISLPSNVACPTTIDVYLKAPGNIVTVPWTCGPPLLNVDHVTLDTSNCTSDNHANWICTVSLSSVSGNEGLLNWSVSGGNSDGITFSQQSGVLAPGQVTQVVMTIPGVSCPGSGTIYFTGAGNRISATWHC